MTESNTKVRKMLEEELAVLNYIESPQDRELIQLHLLREISDQLHMIQEHLNGINHNTRPGPLL